MDMTDPHIQAQLTEMAMRGQAMSNDPNYEWQDIEEVLPQFAAPHIAAARKHRGLTQAQLGAKLGMPQSQVSRIESDPESVTYRTLKRVAKALGMTIPDLLSPEFAPKPSKPKK
jgi:HTH-type transcriptional regulator/antitoxin HipB